jgi:acetyl-CoA carboxylase carboxyltransferase component
MSERWARNMVTGFCRIDGRAVGVIANQPWYLGGVIDAAASQKAAKFVRICNSYGLPLVVLVDTPGFLPGTKQ